MKASENLWAREKIETLSLPRPHDLYKETNNFHPSFFIYPFIHLLVCAGEKQINCHSMDIKNNLKENSFAKISMNFNLIFFKVHNNNIYFA